MTYAKAIAIISIWMAPTLIVIFTKEPVLAWCYLASLWGTEYITSWKE
jgi:hypothetical protein